MGRVGGWMDRWVSNLINSWPRRQDWQVNNWRNSALEKGPNGSRHVPYPHKALLLKRFLQSMHKALNIKEIMDNLDFTNTSNFCSSKDTITNMR